MIKVKMKELDNPMITHAVRALGSQKLPVMTAFKITQIGKAVQNKVNAGRDFYLNNILKKYAVVDEAGNFVPEKDEAGADKPGTFKFKEGANQDELNKEVEEYMEMDVEFKIEKITMAELKNVQIEPSLLESVASFIDLPVDYSEEADKAAKVLSLKKD